MKFCLLALLWSCLGVVALPAQDVIKKAAVPPAVMEEFESRFADAESVTWLRQGDQLYGARFLIGEHPAEAIYTPSGDWVQTEQEIPYVEMPDSARKYCRTHYPDYQAKAVKKVSTRKYGILYEIKVAGEAKQIGMTFDMHGKLIERQEMDPAEEDAASPGVKEKFSKLFRKNE